MASPLPTSGGASHPFVQPSRMIRRAPGSTPLIPPSTPAPPPPSRTSALSRPPRRESGRKLKPSHDVSSVRLHRVNCLRFPDLPGRESGRESAGKLKPSHVFSSLSSPLLVSQEFPDLFRKKVVGKAPGKRRETEPSYSGDTCAWFVGATLPPSGVIHPGLPGIAGEGSASPHELALPVRPLDQRRGSAALPPDRACSPRDASEPPKHPPFVTLALGKEAHQFAVY